MLKVFADESLSNYPHKGFFSNVIYNVEKYLKKNPHDASLFLEIYENHNPKGRLETPLRLNRQENWSVGRIYQIVWDETLPISWESGVSMWEKRRRLEAVFLFYAQKLRVNG